jgi:tRNA modification GTPase
VNKIDLVADPLNFESSFKGMSSIHFISSANGRGVDDLVRAISLFSEEFFSPEPALVTRERQRGHLRETVLSLRAAEEAGKGGREEIMAEHLRLASRAVGKLLGRVDVEDILDVIFRDFCIGK